MSEKYAFLVTLRPQSDCCCRGEAEVRILDFKTTWSEFQNANQTATKQDKPEQRIQGAAYVLGRFSSLKDFKSGPKHMPHPVVSHLTVPNENHFLFA